MDQNASEAVKDVRQWYAIKTSWAHGVKVETYYFIEAPEADHEEILGCVVEDYGREHFWSDKFRRTYSEPVEAPPKDWLEKELGDLTIRVRNTTILMNEIWRELCKTRDRR